MRFEVAKEAMFGGGSRGYFKNKKKKIYENHQFMSMISGYQLDCVKIVDFSNQCSNLNFTYLYLIDTQEKTRVRKSQITRD